MKRCPTLTTNRIWPVHLCMGSQDLLAPQLNYFWQGLQHQSGISSNTGVYYHCKRPGVHNSLCSSAVHHSGSAQSLRFVNIVLKVRIVAVCFRSPTVQSLRF